MKIGPAYKTQTCKELGWVFLDAQFLTGAVFDQLSFRLFFSKPQEIGDFNIVYVKNIC